MTGQRLVTIVRDTFGILAALPIFIALVVLSPLLKPRGGVVASRYRHVAGGWYKTFLAEDPAHRATVLPGPRPVGGADARTGSAADIS